MTIITNLSFRVPVVSAPTPHFRPSTPRSLNFPRKLPSITARNPTAIFAIDVDDDDEDDNDNNDNDDDEFWLRDENGELVGEICDT